MNKLPLFNLEKLNLGFDGKPAGALTKLSTAAYRAKVTGGWLIILMVSQESVMTFYADPKHEWNGGTLN